MNKLSPERVEERHPIKVSRELLKDQYCKWIFSHHVGVQLYLSIGTTHLRSQYFNEDIWRITKAVEREKPSTATQLAEICMHCAHNDSAARFPWRVNLERVWRHPGDNEYYKRRADEAEARNNAKKAERERKLTELLQAINGVNPWTVEWNPQKDSQ